MSQPSHNKMSKQGGASTRPEPLSDQPHSKYEKIRDLNSGTFGFVQLCKDKTTNELVAIKFIERGDKVCVWERGSLCRGMCTRIQCLRAQAGPPLLLSSALLYCVSAGVSVCVC